MKYYYFTLHFLNFIIHLFYPCSLCIIISLELSHVPQNLTVMIVIQVQQPFWLFLFDPSCHNLFFWQRNILCLANILLIIGCQKATLKQCCYTVFYVARSCNTEPQPEPNSCLFFLVIIGFLGNPAVVVMSCINAC